MSVKPRGYTNLFTGRFDKEIVNLKRERTSRVIYEDKYGDTFVRDKGKLIPVIRRGKYAEWYEDDGSKRKYIVSFDMIDHCSVVVEAECESDAWDNVETLLSEDLLKGYSKDSFETKVTTVKEEECNEGKEISLVSQ